MKETDTPEGLLRLPNVGFTCYANTALQYLNKPFLDIGRKYQLKGSITKYVEEIYRTASDDSSYYKTRALMEDFFTECSKVKEFYCLSLEGRKMGDSMQFVDSILLVLGRENEFFLDYFTSKLVWSSTSNKLCPSCQSAWTPTDHRQFNFIGGGVISHLLLQDLYLKVTCETCEEPLPVNVELPRHLLIRYNTVDPRRLAIDSSFELAPNQAYCLTAIATTSGSHATCYIEKNGQWYSFSDYYYYLVNFNNEYFYSLGYQERPLGLIYSLQESDSVKISAKTIIELMKTYQITHPSDPFTPCEVPKKFISLGQSKKTVYWDQLKSPQVSYFRSGIQQYNKTSQTPASNQHSASSQRALMSQNQSATQNQTLKQSTKSISSTSDITSTSLSREVTGRKGIDPDKTLAISLPTSGTGQGSSIQGKQPDPQPVQNNCNLLTSSEPRENTNPSKSEVYCFMCNSLFLDFNTKNWIWCAICGYKFKNIL